MLLGRFRWVSCQVDHLCELHTDAQRRKALEELPETLAKTYERILIRMKRPTVAFVQRALHWIIYADPPLDVDQLLEAMSIDDDNDILDIESRPEEEDVLHACSSLIRKAHGRLELAHFSVKEYLRTISPAHPRLGAFATTLFTLGKPCLQFLCSPAFNRPLPTTQEDLSTLSRRHPFYEYAVRWLQQHILDGTNITEISTCSNCSIHGSHSISNLYA
jgi:hypothetical protein